MRVDIEIVLGFGKPAPEYQLDDRCELIIP